MKNTLFKCLLLLALAYTTVAGAALYKGYDWDRYLFNKAN